MKSSLPKVLHPVAGHPMIYRIVKEVTSAGAHETRVVVGVGAELVQRVVEPLGATSFVQKRQEGTADAVAAAEPYSLSGAVLIIGGDHPLVTRQDVEFILREFQNSDASLAVVTCDMENPGSYGRIVRHHGELYAIVEAKDASQDTLKIKEVNTGIYVMTAEVLNKYLPQIKNNNAQNEYYFTDIVSLCKESGEVVKAIKGGSHVAEGVNDQRQLAIATKAIFKRKAESLMDAGVVLVDPDNTYVEEDVEIASGTVIYPNVYIKGRTKIGHHCVIEPNCFIDKSEVGDSVVLKSGSYIIESKIGELSAVGPYAHLRPDSELGRDCKIGNFVELKKTKMGDGSKASHLAYLGDAIVGKNVNFGCGSITVNYALDRKKYKTVIEDDCFVGSDCQLIAPVHLGKGAMVGAGSAITKDVPAGALAVGRAKTLIKENYQPKAPSQIQKEDS